MPISKPYYRIMRSCGGAPLNYIYCKTYASDRYNLIHTFKIIENDLKKLFEYVEPAEKNEKVFSHRLYELFLRCATEFETNCKQILLANGYPVRSMDIRDYYKINAANQLSHYEVKLSIWHPGPKIIKPFEEWNSGHSLTWYQDYNDVKHDRSKKFELANLSNVLMASAGLLATLFAQFETEVFDAYSESYHSSSDADGFEYTSNNIFMVKPYRGWTEDESYSFSSGDIIESVSSFQQYPFT